VQNILDGDVKCVLNIFGFYKWQKNKSLIINNNTVCLFERTNKEASNISSMSPAANYKIYRSFFRKLVVV